MALKKVPFYKICSSTKFVNGVKFQNQNFFSALW